MPTTQTSAVALDLLENPKEMLTTQTSAGALDLLENKIDPNRTFTINFAAMHSSALIPSVGDPRLLS